MYNGGDYIEYGVAIFDCLKGGYSANKKILQEKLGFC
jgi:hypothetical protein